MTTDRWDASWRTRVYERVAKTGFSSVTAFAASNPAAPYRALAQQLGKEVAPVQVEHLSREEAMRDGRLGDFARDCLARYLNQTLTDGWPQRTEAHFDLARAFASWSAALGEAHRTEVDTVWERLGELASPGWLPAGPDDPLFARAFDGLAF